MFSIIHFMNVKKSTKQTLPQKQNIVIIKNIVKNFGIYRSVKKKSTKTNSCAKKISKAIFFLSFLFCVQR